MPSDAHCHLFEACRLDPSFEERRRALGVPCAASAWRLDEFEAQEGLASDAAAAGAAPVLPCFGVHPQLPAEEPLSVGASLEAFFALAGGGRLAAVGEIGFDLFDGRFRATEKEQDGLFAAQLDAAREKGLPVVLHLRRAMHKAFEHARGLRDLPSVVFHSYSGTLAEARAILARGVRAYFSFGTVVLLNHKRAMEACALLDASALLTETDAPYQPRRGREASDCADLAPVLEGIARLRAEAGSTCSSIDELQAAVDGNFRKAYGID